MTALERIPDDIEEALTAYLSGLRLTAILRDPKDPLPMILVRNLGGVDDAELEFSDPLVSVRTLCDKALGEDAAKDTCAQTHAWMLNLAVNQDDIELASGRIVNFAYVKVVESPRWVKFEDDQVLCKLARYGIGLSFA